jgi:TPR repeat protein
MSLLFRSLATLLPLLAVPLAAHEGHVPDDWKPTPFADAAAHAPRPLPDRIVLTWSGDPATTQAVTWRTDPSVRRALAELAVANENGRDLKGAPFPARTEAFVSDLGTAHYHRVEFTGLEPATLYAYRVGNGTIKSEAMAAQLTREAAEAGHQQAAVDYSDMLASGFGGLAQDLAASREWLSKAEHLMPSSLRPKTAGEFFNGFEGPPHDAIRAHAWFNRASSKGYRRSDLSMSAQDAMYAIERFMSADDKRQAENLASSPELN